jgi:hypothetical protein
MLLKPQSPLIQRAVVESEQVETGASPIAVATSTPAGDPAAVCVHSLARLLLGGVCGRCARSSASIRELVACTLCAVQAPSAEQLGAAVDRALGALERSGFVVRRPLHAVLAEERTDWIERDAAAVAEQRRQTAPAAAEAASAEHWLAWMDADDTDTGEVGTSAQAADETDTDDMVTGEVARRPRTRSVRTASSTRARRTRRAHTRRFPGRWMLRHRRPPPPTPR